MIMMWVVLGIIALIALWAIFSYNKLVSLKNQTLNGWKQIDIQLKRRHDLIPNLVETVKGVMKFEQTTLTQVIEARNKAISAQGVADKAVQENALTGALRKLFALVENYPNLKSSENVSRLQEELSATENKISFARQFYNDIATQFNIAQQTFPTNTISNMLGFKAAELFEITDATEKEVPKVLKGPVKPAPEDAPLQPLRSRRDYGEGDATMAKDIPMQNIEEKGQGQGPMGMPPPTLDSPLAPPQPMKDYDDPSCGCMTPPIAPMKQPAVSEEVVLPSDDEEGGFITILVCPDCGTEGPFDFNPPPGIDPEKRKLKCARCKTIIPLNMISKTASNKYVLKTAHCMDHQFKAIKSILKPGELSSGDADKARKALDKIYDKYLELEKHMKSCSGSSC